MVGSAPCARVQVSAVLALTLGAGLVAVQEVPSTARWVTAWSTSQQTLGPPTINNATVRLLARVTSSGESVRLRFDHSFGKAPLEIGRVYVGQRLRRAALAPGSNQEVLFNGRAGVTIPPGASVRSDPVPMQVLARQDLAVSLYVPGTDLRPSQHTQAQVTSYMSTDRSGDVAADESGAPFVRTTTSMFWLKAIDVLSSSSSGTIVTFGDSITDGSCATLDAHDRWVDWLAVRVDLSTDGARPGSHWAVINEGIGGNTITRLQLQPPPNSTPGIERLDRDVLSHAGVTHVVVFMGTNDIRREASAAQVISGMEGIIERVKARGLRTIGVTIIPRHNRAPSGTNTGWSQAKTHIRREVNDWIRSRAAFDGVIDFDRIVRDPANPDLIHPPFDCDGIHPTPRGYYEMGRAVDLDLFRR